MIVQIRDKSALASVPVANIFSYLESRGWNSQGPWGQRPAIIYSKEYGGHACEILAPTRDTLADYVSAVAETIAVLAEVEERSQLDVFYDLKATGVDVIRVHSANGLAHEALSLRQSAGMLNDAYRMLEAGARSAEKPRAIYRGKLSADVAEYLDSVRPLPGYGQGYAVTLHSPVQIELDRQQDMGDEFYTPFPRQVTSALAHGLGNASAALERAVVDNTLEPFREAVASGVSANLCNSVAELAKQGEGIAIELSWADLRPSSLPESRFQFSPASADILMEAANSLRRREASYDEEIVGLVVRLEREPPEFDGKATIGLVWDGRFTRMNVEFEQAVYDLVINAFRDLAQVSLDADVYPSGRGYELRNPRNMRVVPEE